MVLADGIDLLMRVDYLPMEITNNVEYYVNLLNRFNGDLNRK